MKTIVRGTLLGLALAFLAGCGGTSGPPTGSPSSQPTGTKGTPAGAGDRKVGAPQ
jgi:hypothetical protein